MNRSICRQVLECGDEVCEVALWSLGQRDGGEVNGGANARNPLPFGLWSHCTPFGAGGFP
jgi:hypothetical protein